MAERPVADIRNIALVGHGGCGKTTLTERLLLATGTITRMGRVEEGNTVSDWTDLEKEHAHSLQSSIVHFDHHDKTVNLIDTPGMLDFLGQAIASFPAVETVAIVVDAIRGIETGTRRLFQVAADRRLPRMIIINKMDDQQVELEEVVERIRETFGSVCLPLNLPTPDRDGVVNVLTSEHGDTLFSSVEDAHTRILDQVVEVDEELMSEYLDKGAEGMDKARVHDAFRKALREGHLVPIVFVSAKTGVGIEDLLHEFTDLLPSPLQGNPRTFIRTNDDGESSEFLPEADPSKPLIAHVFKVSSDPFVGKLGVFRVHQGVLRAKDEVYVGDARKPIRIGHIFKLQGKDHVEAHEVHPGDIAAVAKIDEVAFNAVLHAEHGEGSIRLKPLPLPKPLFGLAVELVNRADETKFSGAVAKIVAEDPCFVMERVAATHQTVLKGLGELHLRISLEKLKKLYHIEVNTSTPKVAYQETIMGKADGHHRHKKQSGGSGEFGEVYLRVAPLPLDHPEGFEFENVVVGGNIPRQFMPAIEKGVRQVLTEGAIAGYPMRCVRVEVYDGKYHAVDSKEVAFVKAGKRAFIDAVQKARPVLLEPYVNLEVTAPSQYMGDINADISTKRGRVMDTEMSGSDIVIVKAQVPLSELQNYSNQLKSMTGGAGAFSMDFSHEEQAPPNVQAEVVAAFKPREED
ncbi:MAG: elongation factor G [Phycisphaeraceae bacterium]|nr:elongation factor G [Phycisphaeraceae bacterium]